MNLQALNLKQVIFNMENLSKQTITIIGAGNLGLSIINGIVHSGLLNDNKLIVTNLKLDHLKHLEKEGVVLETSNKAAVQKADIVIFCVQPRQLPTIVEEVKGLTDNKILISTITGAKVGKLEEYFGKNNHIVRAMPNTAIAVKQSMTCLSSNGDHDGIKVAQQIFSSLGETIPIEDELMQAATVLGASGVAFWLRLIRATTQGGIQLGFDAPEAKKIAVQTCLGAATLLAENSDAHPEGEIDRVTTPKGCTISGLNEMEHEGLSSALIKGIVASFEKINEIR